MDEKTVTSLFDEMKSDVTSYVTNTAKLAQLEVYEKTSKATASTAYILFIFSTLFLAFALLLFTLGFYLGELLQSYWKGFGIVTAGAIVILLILLLIKKPVTKSITNKVIKFLQHEEDEEVKYSPVN